MFTGIYYLQRRTQKLPPSAPSQKNFDILMSKWRIFVESLVLNFVFIYDHEQ